MSVYDGEVYSGRISSRTEIGQTPDGRIIVERYHDGMPKIYIGRPYGPRC
jgi:hypothetical protein